MMKSRGGHVPQILNMCIFSYPILHNSLRKNGCEYRYFLFKQPSQIHRLSGGVECRFCKRPLFTHSSSVSQSQTDGQTDGGTHAWKRDLNSGAFTIRLKKRTRT